uniref:C-type lectin domain-containing protein n=2 Tax=Oryctolagus cuniculus TaxID=9986 RepID=G1SPC3_RABIT
ILLPMALPRTSWMLLSCLMLLSHVQGEDVQQDVASPRINCPPGSKAYGYHCYAVFVTPKSWMDADLACQKRPLGSLVSIHSAAEASFVSSLIRRTGNSQRNIWMGLHDPTQGTESSGEGWEWSSNDLVHYTAWERNPSTATDRGYCGSLTYASKFLRWRDFNCDLQLPYVCKFRY